MHTPGPSWKVARVQQKETQNNRFSPSIHQLPPVSLFPPSTPLTHSFTFAPPFHRLLPPFPILLLHAHSLPSANRTQSVIPAHSVLCSFWLISPGCPPWLLPFSSPRPSRSFRPTRSTACFLSLSPASVQLGLSRSFRPTQSLAASVLVFTSLFSASPPLPRLSRSFRPTRSLATSSLFLASALPLFHLVSPKPEPSRSFRPTRFLAASFLVLPLALPPLSPFSYFFSTARTQWVIPAHSAFSNLLSLPCFRLPPSFT